MIDIVKKKKKREKHTVPELILVRNNAVISSYSFVLDQVLPFI